MTSRDAMDNFIDQQESDIWHNTSWSFNQKWEAHKEVKAMRANAWKIRFNAMQFNRRAEWMRKTNRTASEAAAMFPVARS